MFRCKFLDIAYPATEHLVEFCKPAHKASAVHRDLALSRLEATLGPYDSRKSARGTTYEGYQRSYSVCLDHLRASQAAAREHLEKVRKEERAKLAALLAEANARAVLLALNRAVDREFEVARDALDEAYGRAKKALPERRLDREAWQQAQEPASIDPVLPPAVLFPTLTPALPVSPSLGVDLAVNDKGPAALQFQIDHRYENRELAFTDHRTLMIVHHLGTGRRADHRDARRAVITAVIVSVSALLPILTSAPATSTSIVPALAFLRRDARSLATIGGAGSCSSRTAGTNMGAARDGAGSARPRSSISLRSKRRHVKSWDADMAWRRATALTLSLPE
ncbi:hypothetical protein QPK87_24360 [Kamptonema cortianum]|nr:hypothetical protein [Kamptonema cortianum]